MDQRQESMVNLAYDILDKEGQAMNFKKLFALVTELKGYSEEEALANISFFYTGITMDGRFMTTGDNNWDLRFRHKFAELEPDMRNIYSDEEEDEYLEEEDDGGSISLEDSYDDED